MIFRAFPGVLIAAVVFSGHAALACVCFHPSPKRGYQTSDAIFVGTVLAIDGGRIEMETSRWFKGDPSETVTVFSSTTDGDCGYAQHMTTGSAYLVWAYLVWAYLDGGRLFTTSCQRTRPLEHASCDLAMLERRRWWWKTTLSSFTPFRWLNDLGLPLPWRMACTSVQNARVAAASRR